MRRKEVETRCGKYKTILVGGGIITPKVEVEVIGKIMEVARSLSY